MAFTSPLHKTPMMMLILIFCHHVTPLSVHLLKWFLGLQPMNSPRFNNLCLTLSSNFLQYLQPLPSLPPPKPLLQTARFFHHPSLVPSFLPGGLVANELLHFG